MKLLISIKPKYVEQIMLGNKTFELRRRFTSKDIDSMLIYRTRDEMKIVGEVHIKKVHKLKLPELWKMVKGKSFVSKEEFYAYYENLTEGYAIELDEINHYDNYVSLKEYGVKRPPQSYMFVNA